MWNGLDKLTSTVKTSQHICRMLFSLGHPRLTCMTYYLILTQILELHDMDVQWRMPLLHRFFASHTHSLYCCIYSLQAHTEPHPYLKCAQIQKLLATGLHWAIPNNQGKFGSAHPFSYKVRVRYAIYIPSCTGLLKTGATNQNAPYLICAWYVRELHHNSERNLWVKGY